MRNVTVLVKRGPFCLQEEIQLMETHHIEFLVTKNSGADAVTSKIQAARHLKIKVIMIERPQRPEGRWLEQVNEVENWLEKTYSLRT